MARFVAVPAELGAQQSADYTRGMEPNPYKPLASPIADDAIPERPVVWFLDPWHPRTLVTVFAGVPVMVVLYILTLFMISGRR